MEGGDDGDGFISGQEGGGGERARDGEGGVAKERNGGRRRRRAAAAAAACGCHGEVVVGRGVAEVVIEKYLVLVEPRAELVRRRHCDFVLSLPVCSRSPNYHS